MTIHMLVVVLLFFVQCFESVFMVSIKFRITRHTLCESSIGGDLNVYNLSLEQCVEKCALRSVCMAVTYKRAAKKCSLYLTEENFESFTLLEMQAMNGDIFGNQCVLIKRNDIDLSEVPPAATCKMDEEFELSTNSCTIRENSYRIQVTAGAECPAWPTEYVTLYGNVRTIRAQLEYVCEFDFPNVRRRTTCLTNGTWTVFPECDLRCLLHLLPSIPNSQITASSSHASNHGTNGSRLERSERNCDAANYVVGAWVASHLDTNPYIQARFNQVMTIRGIVVKGRDRSCGLTQYCEAYTVAYSLDCLAYVPITLENGTTRMFPGSTADTEIEVYSYLQDPVQATCVRLFVVQYINHPALRFDVVGCDAACSTYLVSGLYGVPDSGITASSWDNSGSTILEPSRARLDTPDSTEQYGGWFTSTSDPVYDPHYIQVRFRIVRTVASIVTQGVDTSLHTVTDSGYNGRTETYTVTYSQDCDEFYNITDPDTGDIKIFTGNDDMDTKIENVLPEAVHALCVRIIPITYNVRKGLRFDLKGCVDHVCPDSMGRTIRPNIKSSFKLHVRTGSVGYQQANQICTNLDGSMFNPEDDDKLDYTTKLLYSCSVYADTTTYWVGPHVPDTQAANYRCLIVTSTGQLDLQQGAACVDGGFICEWSLV